MTSAPPRRSAKAHESPTTPPPTTATRTGLVAAERVRLNLLFGHDHPLPFWNLEDDWTDQSDQGAFIDADIPAIYIGVDSTKDDHRPTDTFDRIDQKFLVNAAELVARLVQRLDHAEELPD